MENRYLHVSAVIGWDLCPGCDWTVGQPEVYFIGKGWSGGGVLEVSAGDACAAIRSLIRRAVPARRGSMSGRRDRAPRTPRGSLVSRGSGSRDSFQARGDAADGACVVPEWLHIGKEILRRRTAWLAVD